MMKVPFVDLHAQYLGIKEQIDAAIQDVIAETSFIGGKHVKAFEKAFAELYGVKHVVSCANGTDSLYILMKMLGVGPGDEVITAANSWISSSETITQTGAKPVFLDIDPIYYSMNESLLEAAITPRTKGIIAVHLQGQMCKIDEIQSFCKARGIFLIEDCAQSHFSEYQGVRAGLWGVAGSFSFYPGKNLGAYGDAGCIITDDDALAEKCRMYANHGALEKHSHLIEGINSRLDAIQASILNAKLPYILKWTERRISNASVYNSHLDGIREIVVPIVRPETQHTFHLYVVRAEKRNAIKSYLAEHGVETAIHYPRALPNLPCYNYLKNPTNQFPVASAFQEDVLSLPMYPELTEQQIEHVCKLIRHFYAN